MTPSAMYLWDLRYQTLTDCSARSHDVIKAIEYFVTAQQEREEVGTSRIAQALYEQALRDDLFLPEKAISGLVQLEAWDELGRLACVLLAPEELELLGRYWCRSPSREPFGSDSLYRLRQGLVKNLAKPINTDALWPAIQKYFRRKDNSIRRRAIQLVGELHVEAAYRTLRNIVDDPAQPTLHDDAVQALGLIGSDAPVRYILQLLSEPSRQDLGIWGTIHSRSPKAIPILDKLIAAESSAATQFDAIRTLGTIGGDAAARVLLKYLDGPHRSWVIDALGAARSGLAVSCLGRLLRSRNLTKDERDEVAEALSHIDTPEARQVLAKTLAQGHKKAASSTGRALSARRWE